MLTYLLNEVLVVRDDDEPALELLERVDQRLDRLHVCPIYACLCGFIYIQSLRGRTQPYLNTTTYTPRWFVGSSKMTMCGFLYASSAKAARDFCPPERKRMGFMARSPLRPYFPMKLRSSWLSALGSGGFGGMGSCERRQWASTTYERYVGASSPNVQTYISASRRTQGLEVLVRGEAEVELVVVVLREGGEPQVVVPEDMALYVGGVWYCGGSWGGGKRHDVVDRFSIYTSRSAAGS